MEFVTGVVAFLLFFAGRESVNASKEINDIDDSKSLMIQGVSYHVMALFFGLATFFII